MKLGVENTKCMTDSKPIKENCRMIRCCPCKPEKTWYTYLYFNLQRQCATRSCPDFGESNTCQSYYWCSVAVEFRVENLAQHGKPVSCNPRQ
eukprot:113551-Pelagomonas_calceolata.AAC.4